jgi:hypothetical protein
MQNMSHKLELKIMERLYHDRFPGSQLNLTVSGYEGITPNNLTIYDTDYTESYEKDGGIVVCMKNAGGHESHKIQSFDKEEAWVPGKGAVQRRRLRMKPLSV